ncbi:MAG: Spy/CpxP family protein refolding chaperone [Pseudomonadota bacterium]
MNKKSMFLVLTTVLGLWLCGATALAQGPAGPDVLDEDAVWPQLVEQDMGHRALFKDFIKGQRQHRRDLRKKINLSDEQKNKLKAIIARHRSENKPLADEVIKQKRVLRDAVLSENPNEGAIGQAAQELGQALAKASVAAAGIVAEAKKVLTQEQRDLIRQFINTRDKAIDKARKKARTGQGSPAVQ